MKRLLFVLVLGLAAAAAAAVIASGQSPSPPTSGPVRIAQPVDSPPRAGRPPLARIELRLDDPDGGRRLATVVWAARTRTGARMRPASLCISTGVERNVARYPVREGGRCGHSQDEPLAFGVTHGPRVPTVIDGVAPRHVGRITLAGPGGTHELPLSRSRAYAAAFAAQEAGTVTITAHLRDGTTRFREVNLSPGHVLEGAVTVEDPEGGPAWQASADLRGGGARSGQTCPQFSQRVVRTPDGGFAGGEFSPPLCGDLRRNPVLANTMQMRPSTAESPFGPTSRAPKRTIVWGAAGEQVREVAIRDPRGERTLELSPRGRAFLAVYPASVTPDELTLIVRHGDGRVTEHRGPERLGAAPLNPRRTRFVRPLQARLEGSDLVMTAVLSRRVRRYTLSVLGRPVHMRPVPGTRGRYRGVYDASHGKYREHAKAGERIRVSYTVCAPNCTAFDYLELRIR